MANVSTPTAPTGPNKYPDIFKPSAPHPYYHLSPLFREGTLVTKTGEQKTWRELLGKSVALFFHNGQSAKSNNFYPHLLQLYKVFNESGDNQKLEVVYVPLDPTRESYEKEKQRHPWLSIDVEDPIVNDFKQHFRVMNPPDLPKYAYGPRSAPPTMLIIKSDGTLLQDLDMCSVNRSMGLLKWPQCSDTVMDGCIDIFFQTIGKGLVASL